MKIGCVSKGRSLAKISCNGSELDDAKVIANEHPTTFWLSERQQR